MPATSAAGAPWVQARRAAEASVMETLDGGWAALGHVALTGQSALVRDLQAIASPGFCWSPQEMLFRTDTTPDLCKALGHSAELVEVHAAFARNTVGELLPSSGTVVAKRMRGFHQNFDGYSDMSYCWNAHRQAVNISRYRRVPGVAVLLTEHHANSNIGHASRDAGFFAYLLHEEMGARNIGSQNSSLPISMVIVKDHQYHHMVAAGNRAHPFRMESLRALMNGSVPPANIAYIGDREANKTMYSLFDNRTEDGVCFDVAIQRLRMWYFDHGVYREKAWEYCGVDRAQPADTFLIEAHGKVDKTRGTRRWRDQAALASFVQNHSVSEGLTVRVESFDKGWTFCDQVRLYARSRVALHHHGAAVAGNGAFLRPDAVLVELEAVSCISPSREAPDFTKCKGGIGPTLNFGFAHAQGLRYVGGKVVVPTPLDAKPCPSAPDYFYREDCVLDLQYDAFASVLDRVRTLLGAPPPGISSTSAMPSLASTEIARLAGARLRPAPGLGDINLTPVDDATLWRAQLTGLVLLLVVLPVVSLWWFCFGRRRVLAKPVAAAAGEPHVAGGLAGSVPPNLVGNCHRKVVAHSNGQTVA
mmetsp:Transcript_77316/g.224311  ORF Transcript_77316/g.224311 Transcript_77316/m.224311 type:complete len:588 (-) Transcript_77316:162-1925(-)